MAVLITDRSDLMDAEQREFAERRLSFALSRFDSRIVDVELVVWDDNGPRGGVDQACRLHIKLRGGEPIVITDRDSELGRAIARLAERGARSVARAVDRLREHRRPDASSGAAVPTG